LFCFRREYRGSIRRTISPEFHDHDRNEITVVSLFFSPFPLANVLTPTLAARAHGCVISRSCVISRNCVIPFSTRKDSSRTTRIAIKSRRNGLIGGFVCPSIISPLLYPCYMPDYISYTGSFLFTLASHRRATGNSCILIPSSRLDGLSVDGEKKKREIFARLPSSTASPNHSFFRLLPGLRYLRLSRTKERCKQFSQNKAAR